MVPCTHPRTLGETWVHNTVLRTTKPPVAAPVLGPTREYTIRYDSTNIEEETWPNFVFSGKKRLLKTMQTEATKKLRAFLKEKRNLVAQSDKISKEYCEALDAAFPIELSMKDRRITALQRVVKSFQLDTSAIP